MGRYLTPTWVQIWFWSCSENILKECSGHLFSVHLTHADNFRCFTKDLHNCRKFKVKHSQHFHRRHCGTSINQRRKYVFHTLPSLREYWCTSFTSHGTYTRPWRPWTGLGRRRALKLKLEFSATRKGKQDSQILQWGKREKESSVRYGMLSLNDHKEVTFLVRMLFPLSVLKLRYSYLWPEEPSSSMWMME